MARSKKSGLSGPPRKVLEKFDRKPVYETAIAVTNAGDGLSRALAVEPVIMHSDDTVYVVLECRVGDVVMMPQDDDGSGQWFIRKHKLVAGDAAIVDKDLVVGAIQEQRDRIERANGVMQFEFPEGDEGLLVAEFFAAIDEALEAGTVFRDVDADKARELIAGLVEAGWKTDLDKETETIVLTEPDGDRSFAMHVSDDESGATVTDIIKAPGRRRGRPADQADES